MKKGWVALIAIAMATGFISGCETKEDNAISKAQSCLDSSNSSNANDCTKYIEGIETTTAYEQRCSADFITQGFDSVTMAQAFDQLNNSSGNTTTAMMGFLVFSTGGVVDQAAASKAMNDCKKSKISSMALLGSFAQVATIIAASCTATCTFDPTTDRSTGFPSAGFTSGLAALYTVSQPAPGTAQATVNATIGAAVLIAYQQQCSVTTTANASICSEVVGAINGATDPATVGYNLIVSLHNHP